VGVPLIVTGFERIDRRECAARGEALEQPLCKSAVEGADLDHGESPPTPVPHQELRGVLIGTADAVFLPVQCKESSLAASCTGCPQYTSAEEGRGGGLAVSRT
jgi:hypothetical protein